MKLTSSHAALALTACLLAAGPVAAGEGHDHGPAAPTTTGPSLPRFTAVSELFELVGVLNGKQVTLYLDRFADNSPVRDAQIELEIGGAKLKAQKHGDDEYEVMLAETPKPGVLPVTATVVAGKEFDLLAGELDLHEEGHAEESAHARSWKELAAWAAGGMAALALLAWGARRWTKARSARAGGAA